MTLDLWAKIVGACIATFTLLGTLGKPCKAWLVLRWDIAVESSFTRNPKTYNRIMREDVMPREITLLEHSAELSEANKDRLEMAEASLIAQGAALLEIPKISAKMEGLPAAIEKFSEAMTHMAENVGHIKGKMEERERREAIEGRWDGIERRRRAVEQFEEEARQNANLLDIRT